MSFLEGAVPAAPGSCVPTKEVHLVESAGGGNRADSQHQAETQAESIVSRLEDVTESWSLRADKDTGSDSSHHEGAEELQFQQEVRHNLELLSTTNLSSLDNNDDLKVRVVSQAAYYYAESPWCTPATTKLAGEVLAQVAISSETIDSLVQIVKPQLLDLKNSKVSNAGYKKFSLNPGLSSKLHQTTAVQAEDKRYFWKMHNLKSVSLFSFILSQLDFNQVRQYWWLISPTILNILDDHEATIKLQGVQLLDQLLSKIDSQFLSQTGLLEVFLKSLEPLLSYLPRLTPTDQSCLILAKTYPVVIRLLQKHKDKETYNRALISLLNGNIFYSIGLVGDNYSILEILTEQINIVIKELGVSITKTLPRLLYTVGNLISNPFIYTDKTLYVNLLNIIISIELNSWPRMDSHKYDILAMCAICCRYENDAQVVEKLNDILQILSKITDISTEAKEISEKYPEFRILSGNFIKV